MSTNGFRRISTYVLTLGAFVLTGCGRAPSFDILGSFFPAWLACLALGLLLTVTARWLLLRFQYCARAPNFDLSQSDCSVHIRAVAYLLPVMRAHAYGDE